ncbi:MAG: hypothetical protein FJX75_17220 [Armatimonadetes bacterium]|nr:hypothetical protein [Armatimonadota bacterium]
MITKVHARNYRSLGDVEVELGPLTVLVGPNGSGKSNFVDVLRFLRDAFAHGLDAAIASRHGMAEVKRRARGRSRDVALRLSFDGIPMQLHVEVDLEGEYGCEIASSHNGGYRVRSEDLSLVAAGDLGDPQHFATRDGQIIAHSEVFWGGPETLSTALLAPLAPIPWAQRLVEHLATFGFYNVAPDLLREPQKAGAERPLDRRGENLASVLADIARGRSGFLPEIVEAIRVLVPYISDVRVARVGGYLILRFLHNGGDGCRHWFDASQESDGTLRMLGVLTALYQDPPPGLIVLEEPELTIHPGMLALLRDCIEEAASKRTQVIVTTHSPDLMSLFDVGVLRVVEMTEEGTKIGPVADWQKQVVHEKLFSPGELVRIEGLHMEPAGE